MLCKHFHRAQGGQCAVLENAKTRPQKRKMAIFKKGRQKGYKSAHHTSREREREREREISNGPIHFNIWPLFKLPPNLDECSQKFCNYSHIRVRKSGNF